MQTATGQKLDFKTPTIDDAPHIKPYLWHKVRNMSCESTIVTFIMWHELYHHKIAVENNTLFVRLGKEKPVFLLPFGNDIKYGVGRIREHAQAEGVPVRFLAADGIRLDCFKELYGQDYTFKPSRDDYEYIYLSKDLAELSGKKFHSKRNHIASFSKQYNWSYETICDSNLNEVLAMSDKWRKLHDEDNTDNGISVENRAIRTVLTNRELLGVKGGLIRVDGEIVAFTFGSPINDLVFNVHVEKALPEYRTAYSVINQEFVRHELTSFQYINREDDMGLEGLRKAKLSYHPYLVLPKYIITAKD